MNNLRARFPHYFKPTQAEFENIWKNATIAIDTNILLNLYRYSDVTQAELLKILTLAKDRIWIPYQAATEFLRNRISTNGSQLNDFNEPFKKIDAFSNAMSTLSTSRRHPFINKVLFEEATTVIEKILFELESQKKTIQSRIETDEILDEIVKIFSENIGNSFTITDLEEIYKEGKKRYESKIPPGYMDDNKDSNLVRRFGDLVIWKELIKKAKETQKPLIFVTDDNKEDWWEKYKEKVIQPRPELIEEFTIESNQAFYIYNAESFIYYANSYFTETVSEEVIKELADVRQELTLFNIETPENHRQPPKFVVFLGKLNINYFRLEDENEFTILDSESFESRSLCMKALNNVKDGKFNPSVNFHKDGSVSYDLYDFLFQLIATTNSYQNMDLLNIEMNKILKIASEAITERVTEA